MNEEAPPLYDVEELTLEEAILALASQQEKNQTEYREASERLLRLSA